MRIYNFDNILIELSDKHPNKHVKAICDQMITFINTGALDDL